MISFTKPSSLTLYQIICASFCIIAVMSNIISAKMIHLPFLQEFSIPAGLITYPITFLLSDLVTEVFGPKRAKVMVYIALGMNLLSFGIIQLALMLPNIDAQEQAVFKAVLGLSGLRIFASLTAYIVAQLVDIQLYALIKKWTGTPHLWLRNNGSTCASQIVDTVIVDLIYLYMGLGMGLLEVASIMLISYAYKVIFSFVNTPLFYLFVHLVKINWKLPLLESHIKGVKYGTNL